MPKALTNSAFLFTVPAVDLTGSIILTPASYATWDAFFTANASVLEILLTPGDYTSWGPIDLYNRHGGSAIRYKTIRYYDSDAATHPVRRAANKQAYVDAVKLTGPLSHHWVVQGLWINNPSVNCGTSLETTDVVFDYNVIERAEVYGLRMNSCQRCYVQRNVIRNLTALSFPGDSIGVQFKNADSLELFDTIDNFLLDNEIYNCGDPYGFTEAVTLFRPIEVTVDGNDFYIEPDQYLTTMNVPSVDGTRTWRENAGDFKAGSDRPGKNRVTNNRAWGMRRNAGPTALGEAWVFQKYCRGFDFEDNITGDCPRGMKDENWPAGTHTVTVDPVADTLTYNNHHLRSGDCQLLIKNTGGTFPGGLNGTTSYWPIYVSNNVFKLATSKQNALDGIAIDITTTGTGTNQWKFDPAMSRNIHFRRNQWYNVTDKDVLDIGAVLKPITDISFEGEIVSRSTYLCDISPTLYYGPTFTGLTLTEVGAIQRPEDQTPALPYVPGLNTIQAPLGAWDTYERKRWTGPEWAEGAVSIASAVTPDPDPIEDNPTGDPPEPDVTPPIIPTVAAHAAVSHRGGLVFERQGPVSHRGKIPHPEEQ